jgi:hypothetical protein
MISNGTGFSNQLVPQVYAVVLSTIADQESHPQFGKAMAAIQTQFPFLKNPGE